jgi:hypothetical protein
MRVKKPLESPQERNLHDHHKLLIDDALGHLAPEVRAIALPVFRQAQALARDWFSCRFNTPTQLIEIIRKQKGFNQDINPAHIEILLRDEKGSQDFLRRRMETSLWRASDKTWRLTTLALPQRTAHARRRVQQIASPTCCRWCLLDEGFAAPKELEQELAANGNPVPGSYFHRTGGAWGCRFAFEQLRLLARWGVDPEPLPPREERDVTPPDVETLL